VINAASNVTVTSYNIAIISGDVSDILGPLGQDFCDQLGVYAAYPDQSPPQQGAGTHRRNNQNADLSFQKFSGGDTPNPHSGRGRPPPATNTQPGL